LLVCPRQYNVDYKLETYLKIARLYLEDDDPVQAEAYINRASLLQNESTNEQLQIHYKVTSDLIATPVMNVHMFQKLSSPLVFDPPVSLIGAFSPYRFAMRVSLITEGNSLRPPRGTMSSLTRQ
jgi:hypothetical protein